LDLDWVMCGVIDSVDPKAGLGIVIIEGTR
jgi:hypothetical protein